jgi:hypothetical protein
MIRAKPHKGKCMTGYSDPGNGQEKILHCTKLPQAKPFLRTTHLSHWNGPPQVFKEEPVTPLW